MVEGQAAIAEGDGLLVSREGIGPPPVWVGRCGVFRTAPVEGVVMTDNIEPVVFPRAPAVQAAVVERASWRLSELMGPPKGIEIGGQRVTAPSEHRGIFVRSVRKTRRSGPPWLVIVGQRDGQVGVVLSDKLATETYVGAVFDVPEAETLRIRTLPVWDLNGDGQRELVVYADGADGSGVRLMVEVELTGKGRLTLDKMVRRGPIDCPS
jgi:hypothetical protein